MVNLTLDVQIIPPWSPQVAPQKCPFSVTEVELQHDSRKPEIRSSNATTNNNHPSKDWMSTICTILWDDPWTGRNEFWRRSTRHEIWRRPRPVWYVMTLGWRRLSLAWNMTTPTFVVKYDDAYAWHEIWRRPLSAGMFKWPISCLNAWDHSVCIYALNDNTIA